MLHATLAIDVESAVESGRWHRDTQERIRDFQAQRLKRDGRLVPVSIAVSPVSDAAGEIIGSSTILRDVSERQAAAVHQRMLVAELDHRVKNTLAVVASLASQTPVFSG